MEKYFIGIDSGTSGIKAVLFDLKGNELGQKSFPLKGIFPREDMYEEDMLEIPAVKLNPGEDPWACALRELKEENRQLRSRLPSVKEQLKEAEEQQRLLNENYDLRVEVEYLTESLNSERDFSSRLLEGIGAVLDFLDRHLPEQFRPLVEKARELLPVPELQQPEQEQERGHTWGGMEL